MRSLPILTILSFLLVAGATVHSQEQPAQRPPGSLLYLGHTPDTGWQVFQIRFENEKIRQVSTSFGDKRDPEFEPVTKRFLYKNSLGQVLQIPADGGDGSSETVLSDQITGIANFVMSRGGHDLFFTRPAAEKYRQDIWRLDLKAKGEPLLAAAVPAGMLKQVALSPDGKRLAATHIVRANEERLVVASASDGGEVEHLTPEMTMAANPSWLPDSRRIVFSWGKNRGSMKIAEIDIETKEIKELTESSGADHYHPVSDRDDKFIFFEERSADSSSLAFLDRASGKITKLNLPHQARQPHWFDQN
jgi:hypothetical protein